MNDWLKENGITILITVAGCLVAYTTTNVAYGQRIAAIEARQDRQGTAIMTLQDDNTQTLVALAKIQTDIDYIKTQLNKIVQ
jgi:hypothetical protein